MLLAMPTCAESYLKRTGSALIIVCPGPRRMEFVAPLKFHVTPPKLLAALIPAPPLPSWELIFVDLPGGRSNFTPAPGNDACPFKLKGTLIIRQLHMRAITI